MIKAMILSYVVSAESCTLCFPDAPFYDTRGMMLTILMMLTETINNAVIKQ